MSRFGGAAEENNLEPFSAPEVLEHLENWSDLLSSDPDVTGRIETILAEGFAIDGSESDVASEEPERSANMPEPSS